MVHWKAVIKQKRLASFTERIINSASLGHGNNRFQPSSLQPDIRDSKCMTFHPLFGSLFVKPSRLWNGRTGNSEVLGVVLYSTPWRCMTSINPLAEIVNWSPSCICLIIRLDHDISIFHRAKDLGWISRVRFALVNYASSRTVLCKCLSCSRIGHHQGISAMIE